MSYYKSRGNGNSGSWGNQQGSNNPLQPATMTVLTEGKRMCVINAYSRNDGTRMAQVSFCEVGAIPDAVSEMGDTRMFGTQIERAFLTVPEALKAANDWLSGMSQKANDL